MRVRKLDMTVNPDGRISYDMVFGQGQNNFWRDTPDAPAQCALTRLMLFTGEWFLQTQDGTPWRTRVLGKRTNATRDPAMRARILGTQGVSGIKAYASQVNRDTREYDVQCTLDTIYGSAVVKTGTAATVDVDVRNGR